MMSANSAGPKAGMDDIPPNLAADFFDMEIVNEPVVKDNTLHSIGVSRRMVRQEIQGRIDRAITDGELALKPSGYLSLCNLESWAQKGMPGWPVAPQYQALLAEIRLASRPVGDLSRYIVTDRQRRLFELGILMFEKVYKDDPGGRNKKAEAEKFLRTHAPPDLDIQDQEVKALRVLFSTPESKKPGPKPAPSE